jgi:hypothetical protein
MMRRRRWTSRVVDNMTMMHYVMTMMHHTTMMSDRVMGLGHRGGCHGKQNDNQ